MLHYPDWDVPFEIHTDASSKAVAAILCQRIEEKERVLMYASKTLSPAEQSYHIYEKEALAVVWAAEVFRKYIRNKRTVVKTDCAALQWLRSRNENTRVIRWVVKLAEFDLDIQHRKGKNSANVDGITRTPPPPSDTYGNVEVEPLYDVNTVSSTCVGVATRSKRTYGESEEEETSKKKKKKASEEEGEEETERDEEEEQREKEREEEIEKMIDIELVREKEREEKEQKEREERGERDKREKEKESEEKEERPRAPREWREYWEDKIREARVDEEETKYREKNERIAIETIGERRRRGYRDDDEIDRKHTEEEEDEKEAREVKEAGKPYFDCERDEDVTCKEDIMRAQADTSSKCMAYVRMNMDKWAHKIFYTTRDGLVVAKRAGEEWGKVVAPESIRAYILRNFHNSNLAGHQGERRTFAQIRQYFFWPGMKNQIFKWVKACAACRRRKTPRPMRAGITEAVLAAYPNETVAIDFLGPFPVSDHGHRFILTMIDVFTRWPVAVPLKDRSSASVANAIYKHWICEKGVPLKIVSDQAREFISKGMRQLGEYMGTGMVTTSGYNPTGNSSVERFHRYLNASLSIVYEKVLANWDEYLPPVLFSYRASRNDTTGHTPFFLEHGREPQLPLGNILPYMKRKEESEEFVREITEKLEAAMEKARGLQKRAADKNKARKPEQFKPNFKPGDLLMLKIRAAKEGRLHEKDDAGRTVSIPEKLRNPFIGPFRMIRWVNDRNCALDMDGKESIHNVNRLIRHVWDDSHVCTDGALTTSLPSIPPTPPPNHL